MLTIDTPFAAGQDQFEQQSCPPAIAALDAAWQRYLDHAEAFRQASRATAAAVNDALASEASQGLFQAWDAGFEPRVVWNRLAQQLGQYARRELMLPGVTVVLEDEKLQAMPETAVGRRRVIDDEDLGGLRSLSLRTVWDRYAQVLEPGAARRAAHAQASKTLRSALWRHMARRHGNDALPIGQRGGRFVFTASYGRDYYASGYRLSWDGAARLAKEGAAIATLCALEGEAQMGLAVERGLAAAAEGLKQGYRSRDRIQVSGEMHLVVFKESVEWHLTPELWTLLQAAADWVEPEY